MIETINNFILAIADPLMNWILYLPRDVAMVFVAVLTSVLITVIRKWTTDQDWLRRADEDQRRLKALIGEARKARDREARTRYKATLAMIKMRSLKFEGKPLLFAIIPILLIATWCFARLGFEPLHGGAPVSVRMYLPVSAIGRLAHMAPQAGIESDAGWIHEVVRDSYPETSGWWERANHAAMKKAGMLPPLEGVVEWKIEAEPRREPYTLMLVFDEICYQKQLEVGRRTYAPQVKLFVADSPARAIEICMRPRKLFGVVPGIPLLLHMPPWLVAYLLIVIILFPVSKRLLRVH